MSRNTFFTAGVLCTAAVISFAISPRLLGQAAPGQSTTDEKTEKTEKTEEVVKLSPFIVESEETGDYAANSTLAGTRVRTDLKDVAASISVVTKQFLQDTAVRNAQDLLVYTPSTEVGGIRGNFSGIAGQKVPNESKLLANPSTNNRVRGLDAADSTRDYFLTDIPWDSFNTGRIDLQRGPNSILFGVGSPAGIINASINDASYKTAYKVENSIDEYGSLRNVGDFNQVLVPNQLAVRVSLLDDRQKFQQKPAFLDQSRVYAALRYDAKLFGEGNLTTIRIKYEDGRVNSNYPRSIPPNDRITPWFGDPYNKATIDTNKYGFGSLAANNPAVTLWKPGGNLIFQGLASTVDVRSWYNGANAAGTLPTFSNNPTTVMVGMINAGIKGLNSQAYRPFAIAPYSIMANATLPGGSFYLDKVLTDSTVFNFFDNLLDGPNKHEWQDWDALNIDLQQSFFKNRLAFDFTYDKQSFLLGQVSWMAGSDYGIGIEVNETFPDGSANPNVGRPYVTGTDAFGNANFKSDREGKRGIVTVDLKSEDYFGMNWFSYILGRSVFTGLAAVDTRDTKQVQWAQHATTPDLIDLLGQGAQAYANIVGTRQYDWLYYIGPSLKTAASAHGANVSRILSPLTPANSTTVRYFNSRWAVSTDPTQAGYVNPTASYSYFNNNDANPRNDVGVQTDNPANYAGWTNGGVTWLSASNPADFPSLVTGGQRDTFKDDSRGFTWQGYLLGGDLVPTFGWRKDTVTYRAAAAQVNSATGIAPLEYDLDPATARQATGQSRNWSGVYHLPAKLTSKLPWNTQLSVFYNESSNFKADAPRRNLIGDLIANPQGKTREKGFVISTLDDRVTLRATWFETRVANATLAAGGGAIFGPNAYQLHRL
ncbi:MAG: TonB-dependent receptor plug domain-containing protein [Opitutaceae bacterium]|nr:TonB-dependent receptor plug domain-containing protein [Opitutaceae bacterium]